MALEFVRSSSSMASLVIKVKYEETLRRFNVAVNGDGRLDLSMEGLWLKICSLFNLPSDSEFRLSYKDKDDDLITLVDDDDLHDVARQGLDTVRITVHLISDQRPQLNHDGTKTVNSDEILSIISDFLKKVTIAKEPQSETMTKVGTEKIDDIKKRSDVTEVGVGVSVKPSSSKHSSYKSFYSKHSRYNKPSSNKWFRSAPGNKNKDIFALKRDYVEHLRLEKELTSNAANKSAEKIAPAYDQSFKPIYSFNTNSNKTDSMASVVHTGITCDNCGLNPISGPRFKSKVKFDYDLCRSCFLRVGNEMDYSRIDLSMSNKPPQSVPVKASDADNIGSIIHKGINCNGCGVLPISGPRFKSKVKYNYDLCNNCFSRTGNDLEYTRIDSPLAYKQLPETVGLGSIS